MVAENIKFSKDINLLGNEIQNAVAQNLIAAPENAKGGLFYYDTVQKTILFYNGTDWVDAGAQGKIYVNGTGISINGTTISIDETVVAKKSDLPSKISDLTDDTATHPVDKADTLTGLTATVAELNYVDGVTSAIQTQINNKVTKNSDITAGTYKKVTVDAKGLVTAGADLSASDIPDLSSTYIAANLKGANSGVAELDAYGKVPSSQLPSFVDDVVELLTVGTAPSTCAKDDLYYNSTSKKIFTATAANTWGTTGADPEKGKIYVALDNNASYRWSGSVMTNIANPISAATESAAGIAEIATQTEVNTGTDDSRIVTPKKLASYTNGMAKKITATNPALTASGGVCTWTISNTLGTEFVNVMMIEAATGDEVIPAKNVTQSNIILKMNSTSNIAAGTYKVSIEG